MKEEEIIEYLKKCTGCLRCEYFLGEDELGWGHCKLRDELDYIKNNKSNEEILKEFKEQIDSGNDYIHLWWKNAQGLLDLYNKEKEKNNKIENYCRHNLAFKRHLIRTYQMPDMFNQGRFYTSQNIINIICEKAEEEEE